MKFCQRHIFFCYDEETKNDSSACVYARRCRAYYEIEKHLQVVDNVKIKTSLLVLSSLSGKSQMYLQESKTIKRHLKKHKSLPYLAGPELLSHHNPLFVLHSLDPV